MTASTLIPTLGAAMTITSLRRYVGALEQAREKSILVVAATTSAMKRSRRRATQGTDPEVDAIEAEIDALIADQENRTLAEIEVALRTLHDHPDAFGHCEVCGAAIDREHLDAIPWESRCTAHRDEEVAV